MVSGEHQNEMMGVLCRVDRQVQDCQARIFYSVNKWAVLK